MLGPQSPCRAGEKVKEVTFFFFWLQKALLFQRSNFKVIRQVGTNSLSRRKCTLKEGRPVGHMGALGTILCKSLVLKTETYSFNKSLFGSLETPVELLFLLREINWPNPLEEGRVEYIILERWLSGNLVTGLTSFSFSSSFLTKIH